MNIMAIADTESTALWDHYNANPITNTDIILSCGDLDPRYLSFLVTCTNVPLLYVHGNHDEKYDTIPPEGCICIDDKIYVHEGVRILGLGGVPSATATENICILKKKCSDASAVLSFS